MNNDEINAELLRLVRFEEILLDLIKREQLNPKSKFSMFDYPIINSFIKRSIISEKQYLLDEPEEYKSLYLQEHFKN